MKRVTIIFLFFLVLSNAFAQHEFAPVGAEWHFQKLEGTNPPNEGYLIYRSERDSLIGDIRARVLSRTYHHSDGIQKTKLDELLVFQEDSCIYIVKNQKPYKLYDFKAKPGDLWTVHSFFPEWNICSYDTIGTVIVDSIGYISINGQSLKAIYTSPYLDSKWAFRNVILERIGCINHLFAQPKACFIDVPEIEGELRCYNDDLLGIAKFNYCKITNGDCKTLYNYSSSEPLDGCFQPRMKIIINNNKLFIAWDNQPNLSGDEMVYIYTFSGHKLGEFSIEEKIDVSNLTVGFYILCVQTNTTKFNAKFIKY
jgi:hypothetical protein